MADKNLGLTTTVADPSDSDVDQREHSRHSVETEKVGLEVCLPIEYERRQKLTPCM